MIVLELEKWRSIVVLQEVTENFAVVGTIAGDCAAAGAVTKEWVVVETVAEDCAATKEITLLLETVQQEQEQ